MRKESSIKNSIFTMIYYCVGVIIGLITQSIFIRQMGSEYLGIKSLFSNIISMLSIAELGFGSAIVYKLYAPLADKNYSEIRSIIKYYKKIYNIIAVVILLLGIIVIPFIPNIVGDTTIDDNLYILFLLFIIDTVISYLLIYKRSVMIADQRNYIINIVQTITMVLFNIIQSITLILYKNFYMYLIIKIIFTLIENIVINKIVLRKYIYLQDLTDVKELNDNTKLDIKNKVKGLIYHKCSAFIINGTDNIIISIALGVNTVGIYTNYNMIFNYVNNIFGNVISSLTSSIGNLIVEKNKPKAKNIYHSLFLLNSWIFCFCSVALFLLIEPFITIWVGSEYILTKFVLIVLVIKFYLQGIRKTSLTFQDAGGVFYENRHVPIIESILNIIFSIVFVKFYGLAGVFIGTILSTLVLFIYSFPKYIYINLLNGTYMQFAKLHLKHIAISIIIFLIAVFIGEIIKIDNIWLTMLYRVIVSIIVPNGIYLILSWKDKDFEYYKDNIINKIRERFRCKK